MTGNPWKSLNIQVSEPSQTDWLHATLKRNANTAYLRKFGSPRTIQEYRNQVPPGSFDELAPYMNRILTGERDVLFEGNPVAYEHTGGSSGGAKLIPYSREGLLDFQRCIVPWLARIANTYNISGRAYFSISPVAREPQSLGEIPIGLSDVDYLGEHAGSVLALQTAVPFSVGSLKDITTWREETIKHLRAATDLELISVWSPTFLLRILEDIPDAQHCWPRLKVVSCWASGPARRYVDQIQKKLPHATIQPKGLLSTEAVVTVPDNSDKPVMVQHGFVEFAQDHDLLLEEELKHNSEYGVVVTTASGLYRYRTGDRVRFEGRNQCGQPILEFVGRDSLTCDLVGEKLTETFVSKCLEPLPEFAMLVPNFSNPGYVLICEQKFTSDQLCKIEKALCTNPQYAYARKLGQLTPLRMLHICHAYSVVERTMVDRGTRLGDVKPVALRSEEFWLPMFKEVSQ